MPDLLAHALIAYTAALLLSWRYVWITPPYTTVAMAGAFVPDLTKVRLLVRSGYVEHLLNIPFHWGALHTTGGAIVAVLIGVTVVTRRHRTRVGLLLSLGAATHLVADALLLTPSGRSYAVLWPLTRWHPPTPGLYLSTQPEPTLVAAAVALGVWLVTRVRERPETTNES